MNNNICRFRVDKDSAAVAVVRVCIYACAAEYNWSYMSWSGMSLHSKMTTHKSILGVQDCSLRSSSTLLEQIPCVDSNEVVHDHCDHGKSAEAVGEVVQRVMADHNDYTEETIRYKYSKWVMNHMTPTTV